MWVIEVGVVCGGLSIGFTAQVHGGQRLGVWAMVIFLSDFVRFMSIMGF